MKAAQAFGLSLLPDGSIVYMNSCTMEHIKFFLLPLQSAVSKTWFDLRNGRSNL